MLFKSTPAFLAAAVLLSGVGLSRELIAAPQDKPKEEKNVVPKIELPKVEPPIKPKTDLRKVEPPIKPKDPGEQFLRPRPLPPMRRPLDQGGLEQYQRALMKLMEGMQQQFQGELGGALGGLGGLGGGQPGRSSGRLGAMVETPHPALVEQLDLPKEQGLVLRDMTAESPAAKAGLKTNDILLEINGKPVSSDPNEFRKQLVDVKADTEVDAVVLRKGKRETIKGLKLPEAAPEPENAFGGPLRFQLPELPNLQPRAIPFPGGNLGGGAGVGEKGTSISVQNDQFTIRSRDGAMEVTVGGKLAEGGNTVNSIKITDGNDSITVDALDKVPAKYKEKVQEVLKSMKVGK